MSHMAPLLLTDTVPRLRARHMPTYDGKARNLRDVALVHAPPPFCHFPVTDPVLGIGQRVFDLQGHTVVDLLNPLDNLQILAGRNAGIYPMVIWDEIPCIDYQRF